MGRFRKQSPGDGKKTVATWSALKLEEGEGVNLWKMGETLWFWSHFVNGRSIPCLHEFTGGEAKCTRCGTRDFWQGYTPCYDETGARLLALPKDANRAIDDKIKPGQPVYVSRKKGRQKPMTIVPKPWAKDWLLTDRDLAAIADLEQCLVMIWKEPVIRDWYTRQGGEDVTLRAAVAKAEASREEADEDTKRLRALIERDLKFRPRSPGADGPVSVADALPGVNGRAARK